MIRGSPAFHQGSETSAFAETTKRAITMLVHAAKLQTKLLECFIRQCAKLIHTKVVMQFGRHIFSKSQHFCKRLHLNKGALAARPAFSRQI
jgi:hypothetical protein